jgi:ribosomal protein L21
MDRLDKDKICGLPAGRLSARITALIPGPDTDRILLDSWPRLTYLREPNAAWGFLRRSPLVAVKQGLPHRLHPAVSPDGSGRFVSDWQKDGPPRGESRTNTKGQKMFAVIKTGGKQYRVAANDVLTIEKLDGAAGDTVEFNEILMVGEGAGASVGAPFVEGAMVVAEVVEQGRARKVIAFKKRRRQNSKRIRGHRQHQTVVKITDILTGGAKPSKKAAAKKEAAPKAEAPAKTEAAATAAPVHRTRRRA